MAPLALRPWADLPEDPLYEILRRLPCLADRDRMSQICRGWRSALPRCLRPTPTPPAPLPWLLLPSSGAEPTRVCCVIDGCRPHHRLRTAHGARIFGSHSGGWIFAAVDQTGGHALINIRARHSEQSILPVPDLLLSNRGDGDQGLEEMVMMAAALSSSPQDESCIGAGIIKRFNLMAGPRQVVFWRMGDRVAVDAMPHILHQPCLEVEDVVYFRESFYLLTQEEHLRLCAPDFVEGVGLQLSTDLVFWFEDRKLLQEEQGEQGQQGELAEQDERVMARYLVESRGDLLMVVRLGNVDAGCQMPTSKFMVFEATQMKMTDNGGGLRFLWKKLEMLDGRILFVGRGCSKSFEVQEYLELGLEEGVFFTDDESFHYEAVMFSDSDDRDYTCCDNGFWSARRDQIIHCFVEQDRSNHSSPGWLLP